MVVYIILDLGLKYYKVQTILYDSNPTVRFRFKGDISLTRFSAFCRARDKATDSCGCFLHLLHVKSTASRRFCNITSAATSTACYGKHDCYSKHACYSKHVHVSCQHLPGVRAGTSAARYDKQASCMLWQACMLYSKHGMHVIQQAWHVIASMYVIKQALTRGPCSHFSCYYQQVWQACIDKHACYSKHDMLQQACMLYSNHLPGVRAATSSATSRYDKHACYDKHTCYYGKHACYDKHACYSKHGMLQQVWHVIIASTYPGS